MQPISSLQGIKKYIPSLRVIELEKENRLLRNENEALKEENATFKQDLQDLKLLIEDLRTQLFKRRKQKPPSDSNASSGGLFGNRRKRKRAQRDRASYRRSIPTDDEVTATEEYTLDACTHCGGHLEEWDVRDRFIEDIPEPRKEVTKQTIHIYGCTECGKRQSKIPVPRGHDVVLGPRVKAYILFQLYIIKTSTQEIIDTLQTWFHLTVSEGEVHAIQRSAAAKLQPEYNSIHDELNAQEANHGDETGWKIKGANWFCWARGSPTTKAVLFRIGTRGKGIARKLFEGFTGCLTADGYTSDDNLAQGIDRQLCWVHVLRHAKELSLADALTEEQRASATAFRDGLLRIYASVQRALAQPFDQKKRRRQAARLRRRLNAINQLLPCDTPKKLKNLKLHTQQYEQELFTCLAYTTALPENNLAERIIRPVVIKRKRSFGSMSEQGAHIFATNMSVLYTFWKKHPDTFYEKLNGALGW